MNAFPYVIFLLSAGSVGGLLLAALYPQFGHGTPFDRKIAVIAGRSGPAARPSDGASASTRKRTVEETLLEADELQKAKSRKRYKASLLMRLRQADIAWTKNVYYLICLAVTATSLLITFIAFGWGVLPAVGCSLSSGLLLPHFYVGFRHRKRLKRFRAEFPNAIDVIVRGIKSGLPVGDCLKIVAAESQEPVKSEFKTLVEDQTLGMPLADAVQRLPNRMPLAEANFFAVAILVQSRSGGNLAEILTNLSKVLRERKKLQAKVAAMSAEAKASAGIIGSLPIIVTGLLYLTSPGYITILFTSLTGNIVLSVSGLWMLLGVVVMRQMINFDF